jgi:hypothetical protein
MSSTGPLAEFFSEYPSFLYDPDNSASAEFYRLCDHFGWERNDPDRAEAHAAYKNALTRQFNTNYGTDNDSLASWQSLCGRVGITPIPETLKGCREVRGYVFFFCEKWSAERHILWNTGSGCHARQPCRLGRRLRSRKHRNAFWVCRGSERIHDQHWEVFSEGRHGCRGFVKTSSSTHF